MCPVPFSAHTERETYAGLLDEYKVGISLIFISIIHSSAGRESWTKRSWRLSVPI